ncbi:MAG: hypothetical protein ACP5N7_00030 [Candidatus Pacearchaeota archaeon]
MSDIKIEQVKTFFENLGLESTDFEQLSTSEVTDFSPFITKIKSGIENEIKTDTAFLEELTKPFKDAPIGKEKQLKKAVRKSFGLTFSEDELTKMPFDELISKAKETIASTNTDKSSELQSQLTDYMERYEKLETEVLPSKIEEVNKKWQDKFDAINIRQEVSELVATDVQVKKENIPNFTTIFMGFIHQSGWKVSITDKKELKLTDQEGNPIKKTDGIGVLKVKDALKMFSETVNFNTTPRGETPNIEISTKNKDRQALEMLGKGFGK